jgi:HEPN domain-containing protein
LSIERAEVLRRRARAFLRGAVMLIEVQEWDLAVFDLEQYCQLILKYRLFVERGYYPATHSLRRLIKELSQAHPELRGLIEDEMNLNYMARLEEAYITARYSPYMYEEKEALSLLNFVLKVFKPLVEGSENDR